MSTIRHLQKRQRPTSPSTSRREISYSASSVTVTLPGLKVDSIIAGSSTVSGDPARDWELAQSQSMKRDSIWFQIGILTKKQDQYQTPMCQSAWIWNNNPPPSSSTSSLLRAHLSLEALWIPLLEIQINQECYSCSVLLLSFAAQQTRLILNWLVTRGFKLFITYEENQLGDLVSVSYSKTFWVNVNIRRGGRG